MTRVLVNGFRGKMGQAVVAAVEAADELELVARTDLGDDLARQIEASRADVVVDFTHPDSAVQNVRTILECGARPVIGTTGFRPKDIEELTALASSRGVGGLIAPNFAIGAVLLMKFAAEASRHLPDVEIVELHHNQKADAPSGTAVKTAEWIARERGRPQGMLAEEKELATGARGGRVEGIPVHSVRLPGLVAHQEVLLGGVGQLLTLRHDSLSRESFMPGVVLACRKAPRLDRLHYGLENILDA